MHRSPFSSGSFETIYYREVGEEDCEGTLPFDLGLKDFYNPPKRAKNTTLMIPEYYFKIQYKLIYLVGGYILIV